jgi:type I restriction enzyme R subunit
VAFFQAIKSQFIKYTLSPSQSSPYLDTAIRQIVAGAIVSEQVVDIFDAAGIKKPDISELSSEFMEEVRKLPQKNLALELLRRLINDEIHDHERKNIVKSKQFSDMLDEAIHKYQNRNIDSAQVIEELINLAKMIKQDSQRGLESGLSEDELAFYDALADNESARQVLGDEKLQELARELVRTMKKNRAIDWTLRANVQADMRAQVKRLLRKYGYPPDKAVKATETVMDQTKLLYENWIDETEA